MVSNYHFAINSLISLSVKYFFFEIGQHLAKYRQKFVTLFS